LIKRVGRKIKKKLLLAFTRQDPQAAPIFSGLPAKSADERLGFFYGALPHTPPTL